MNAKKGFVLLSGSLLGMLLVACRAGQRNIEASDPRLQVTPSPVPVPTQVVVEFDPAKANTVVPKDILAEVNFFGGGGGIYYCRFSETYDEPKISEDPRDEELMATSSMTACGWEAKEVLDGILQYPNGKITHQSIQTQEQGGNYYATLSLRPWIDDPVGVYTFTLKGKKGSVTSNAYFHAPQGPRLTEPDAEHIFLSGFAPHEPIRLIYYATPDTRWHGKFSGWQDYQVDGSGRLLVQVGDLSSSGFVVIGSQSGELHGGDMDGRILKQTTLPLVGSLTGNSDYLACPPELATQSHLQSQVEIGLPKKNSLFANPRPDARVVARLSAGTHVFLSDGPYCENGRLWWRAVVRPAGEFGFLMQLDGQNDDLNSYP